MERFSQTEDIHILQDYIPPQSLSRNGTASSPRTNSDADFGDVFGGPPRRSSMDEMRQRYSFADSDALRGGHHHDLGEEAEAETLPYSDSRSGMREKPVFGQDSANRRRQGNEFFDDIFRSDESSSSTPRKDDRADPSGTSPFSLSPKLAKGMDLPTFGSSHRSSHRSKDQASEGITSHSVSSTLSQFSSQSIQVQERKNNIHSRRQSSLSREVSPNSEELSNVIISENADGGGNLKNGVNNCEVLGDCPPFHFSIYKWADKGLPVPLMMPGRGRNGSRLKEMGKTEMPSSSKGSMSSENVEGIKKVNDLLLSTSTQHRSAESSQMVEEEVICLPKSITVSRVQRTVEDVSRDSILKNTRQEMKPNSHSEVAFSGKSNKEIPAVVLDALKSNDLKPLRSLLYDGIGQDNDDKSVKAGGNKSNKKPFVEKILAGKKVIKKRQEKRNALTDTEVDQASVEGSPRKPGYNLGRRMKEFVKIFNHDISSKFKTVVDPQTQSCRWDGTFRPGKEAGLYIAGRNQKLQSHPNKVVTLEDASITELKKVTPSEVDEYLKQSEKRYSATKTEYHISSNASRPKNTSVSSTASIPDVSKTAMGDTDKSFQRDFVMKELPQEKDQKPQPDKEHKDMQIIDAKIQKWSNGKEGNIRSLLSTLQYVLWSESGWKPVPLASIIEGNAVKRSYQRALLCLHPDKLQQKGAASDQKYIAEKVFDVLQEAWTQFNSFGAL